MEGSTVFGRNPVLILAVVQAAIALAVAFGLNLDGQQVGVIMALAAAILGLLANRKVTPNAFLGD
jgi:hypothetical protein